MGKKISRKEKKIRKEIEKGVEGERKDEIS